MSRSSPISTLAVAAALADFAGMDGTAIVDKRAEKFLAIGRQL